MGQKKNSKNARKLNPMYEGLEQIAKDRKSVSDAKKMADVDLFSVNVTKGAGMKRQREKLAADRFKQENMDGHMKSKTE